MANKNRTLIKLDNKVIEITQGKKGLVARGTHFPWSQD